MNTCRLFLTLIFRQIYFETNVVFDMLYIIFKSVVEEHIVVSSNCYSLNVSRLHKHFLTLRTGKNTVLIIEEIESQI